MKSEKLKNILSIKKGVKNQITEVVSDNSIRLIQIDDLRNDYNLKFTNDKNGIYVTEDDLLIVWDGANAGTVGYAKEGYIGSTIAVLRKVYPEKYYTPYLGLFLKSNFIYFQNNAKGATIPHLDRKSVDRLLIPIRSYTDQIKIATILEKVENLLRQKKENIDLLDEFLRSTFLKMFGDGSNYKKSELVKFDNHIKFLTSGSRGWAKYYSTSGAKFLRIQNIGNGNLRLEQIQLIDVPETQEANRSRVQEGDLLMTITADLGRTAVIPRNFGEAYINQHIALIRVDNRLNPIYAAYFFSMPFGISIIQSKNKSAVKAGLNFKDISNLEIFVPSIKLQNIFAEIVDRTEKLKQQLKSSLSDLEGLYKSLSQKVFNDENIDLSKIQIETIEQSQTPVKPIITKLENNIKPVERAIKENPEKSKWETIKSFGKGENIPFSTVEGDAVIRLVFSKKTHGFTFLEFDEFLKKEGFVYNYEKIKDFIFSKLESKELIQYYANKEWMTNNYNPQISPLQDDFAGIDGNIWYVPQQSRS